MLQMGENSMVETLFVVCQKKIADASSIQKLSTAYSP